MTHQKFHKHDSQPFDPLFWVGVVLLYATVLGVLSGLYALVSR